jgi:hydroxymethylpyrimidine pyrophosphatase-like HAD family hydrolase
MRKLFLATSLDDSLLGGQKEERAFLKSLFEDVPGHRMVFATGRSLGSLTHVLRDPLVPQPDYIIADVGATVVDGQDFEPIQPIQDELERQWPGRDNVLRALEEFPFLEPQNVPQERRCSFIVDERKINEPLVDTIDALGCCAFFSSGRFLDVLPKQASKGHSLLRLVGLKRIDPGSVVVSGDSLNDLSLFHTGFKGIIVGNAEPDLIESVIPHHNIYKARREGAGGMLEGLIYHGY